MEHDKHVCGIHYEDSCPWCQICFVLSPTRRGEIPTDELETFSGLDLPPDLKDAIVTEIVKRKHLEKIFRQGNEEVERQRRMKR